MMKNGLKFIIFLLILLSILAAIFIPCILQDPYNVFHVNNVRDNGIEPNKNYVKMKYVLSNPQKFDGFLFGSSLTGMVNAENVPDAKCYNMSHSGGLASESCENLKTFIQAGVIPKEIFIGIEPGTYSDSMKNREKDRMRCPYEYSQSNPFEFWSLYLNPKMNWEAYKLIQEYEPMSNEYQAINKDVFYNNGGYPFYGYSWEFDTEAEAENLKETKAEMIAALQDGAISAERPPYMDEALDAIREIKNLCQIYGIKLIVFTNPIYYETFKTAVTDQCYLNFLQELAEITPYYNFSGFNYYTTDLSYYHEDKTHFLVELGDIMLDAMCNGETDEEQLSKGFGMLVTEDNVQQLIDIFTDSKTYA